MKMICATSMPFATEAFSTLGKSHTIMGVDRLEKELATIGKEGYAEAIEARLPLPA